MNSGWFTDRDGNTYFLHDQNEQQSRFYVHGLELDQWRVLLLPGYSCSRPPGGAVSDKEWNDAGHYMVNENGGVDYRWECTVKAVIQKNSAVAFYGFAAEFFSGNKRKIMVY